MSRKDNMTTPITKAKLPAKDHFELWTLTKPINFMVPREVTAGGHYSVEALNLLVLNPPATLTTDSDGLVLITVVGYLPPKDARGQLYLLQHYVTATEIEWQKTTVKLRPSLINARNLMKGDPRSGS